jgi:hypothetical protein
MSSEYHYHNHQQQLIDHYASLIQNNYTLDIILKIQPKQVPLISRSPSSSVTILCNSCKSNLAEIFQVNGDYCLYCWQKITYPGI